MTGLRDAAYRVARAAPAPMPPIERLLAIERVVAGLANRRLSEGSAAYGGKALLSGPWAMATRFEPMLRAAQDGLGRGADRAVILAYLLHYPTDHPDFALLRETVAVAAYRHDWRWRERGRRWRLWDGPATLAAAGHNAWEDAGLVGRLALGAFAKATISINRITLD